jgi:hypothetical protein
MASSNNPIEYRHAVCFACFRRIPRTTLQFKKLRGHTNLWSVRVTLDVRAVGYRKRDIIDWVWIGTHNKFDNFFG